MALDHVMHGLGDVGGVIANSLDVLGAKQMVDAHRYRAGILHRVGEQFPEQRDVERVDLLVALPDLQRLARIAVDEAVEHGGQLRDHQCRHVLEPAHQGALRIIAAHGDDPLADVLRQVADPLEVVGDAQHRHQRAQIDRHRLSQRDRRNGLVLDLSLQIVDRRVGGNDPSRKTDVAPSQSVDRVGNLLLGEAAHLRDHLRELDKVGVEDARGVVGNVHGISVDVGDSHQMRATAVTRHPEQNLTQRLDDSTIRA